MSQSQISESKITQPIPLPIRFLKLITGTKDLFTINSVGYVTKQKQQKITQKPTSKSSDAYLYLISDQYKKQRQEIQKKFTITGLSCIALGGALALSMRRYFPSLYQSSSITKVYVDSGIILLGFLFGLKYGANSVSEKTYAVNRRLLENKDQDFIHWIKQFSRKFGISEKQIVGYIANQDKQRVKLNEILKQYKQQNKNKDQLQKKQSNLIKINKE